METGPQAKSKKEQTQVVNEQDQQEKVNPGAKDFESTSGKNSVELNHSNAKRNQPGLMESEPGLEEGNTYEDDPKREE